MQIYACQPFQRGVMKLHPLYLLFVSILIVFLSACGGQDVTPVAETPTIAITSTPDLCAPENLPTEVTKVNKLMREFDDYAALASNTPQAQLVTVIPEMQRILREAEDQVVPSCLQTLKILQVDHMTLVVQTLLAFVGNADTNLINSGISRARDLHSHYDVEMARLLGITLVVPTAQPTPVLPTATPVPVMINPGPNAINLRNAPDFNAPQSGVVAVQESANIIGRTADSQWILIDDPNQPGRTAWVYSSLVQLSIPIEQLPVVTP